VGCCSCSLCVALLFALYSGFALVSDMGSESDGLL
jgi:hypothetical protein